MNKLEAKMALIAGGNSGIGLATAKQFVNEGAYVLRTSCTQPRRWSKAGEPVTAGPRAAGSPSSCPSQKSSAARADPAPIQSSFSRSGTPPASTPDCCRWPTVGSSMLPTRRSPPMWGSVPPVAADLAWRSPPTSTRRTCHMSTPRTSCAEPTRSALTRTPRVATSTSRSASTAHS